MTTRLLCSEEILIEPKNPCGTAVLTIAGSNGRIDTDRARALASHGALSMSMRWFGETRQQPGPWHVPIETFLAALDRLAIMGISFGADDWVPQQDPPAFKDWYQTSLAGAPERVHAGRPGQSPSES